MTDHLAPSSTPDPFAATRRTRGLVVVALILGLGLGATVTGIVANRSDDSSATPASAAQLSDIQASCEGWMGSQDATSSDPSWCTEMFVWMGETSGSSMMGAMMWQDPARMTTACRNWVDQRRESDAESLARCSDMVQWMDDHMSRDGGRWMMGSSSS